MSWGQASTSHVDQHFTNWRLLGASHKMGTLYPASAFLSYCSLHCESNARKNKEATAINHGLRFLAGNVWAYVLMKVVVLGLSDVVSYVIRSVFVGQATWPDALQDLSPTGIESPLYILSLFNRVFYLRNHKLISIKYIRDFNTHRSVHR